MISPSPIRREYTTFTLARSHNPLVHQDALNEMSFLYSFIPHNATPHLASSKRRPRIDIAPRVVVQVILNTRVGCLVRAREGDQRRGLDAAGAVGDGELRA